MIQGLNTPIGKETKEVAENAARVRDITHNLDLKDPIEREIYYSHLYDHIEEFEKFVPHVYGDGDQFATPVFPSSKVKGLRTIGIGFNMDRPEAKTEWKQVFGSSVSFDAARNGEVKLTKDQGRTLLVLSVSQRERELEKVYYPRWEKFKPNERLIITDMYFQSPKLARVGTNFHGNMMKYSETNDPDYLERARAEVRYRSNASCLGGITKRNTSRDGKLDSMAAPLYSRHDEPAIPDKKITATPGKTIIPYSFGEGRKPNPAYKDYFIWRTQRDSKVRKEHFEKEGIIYHKGEIEFNDFNCRCYPEPVPDNVDLGLTKFITTPFYIEKHDVEINARIQKLDYQIMMIKKAVNYPSIY